MGTYKFQGGLLARVGDAVAAPAANTLLARVKTLTDRVGDAIAAPAANTLLARLKAIGDALAGTLAVRAPAPAAPLPATIANNAALSDAVDLGDNRLRAVMVPAGWTAAGLSFQVSHDGAAFVDLHGAAAETTVAAGASRAVVVDAAAFAPFRHVKVRSGTAAAAVNQGGERVLQLVTASR